MNFYGDYLYAIGDYQQAEIYEKRAAELEPLSAANHHELALVYYLMGRVEDAITLERMAIELNPDFQNARSTLARLLLETGLHDELDELMEEPGTTIGERSEIWMKARLLIEQDKHGSAVIEAERLVQPTTEKGQSQVRAAMLFALLNEDAVAAELLEKAHAEGDPILISPLYFFLPEDWTGLPLVQQALDKPDLDELYDLRRANISAGKGRVTPVLNQ